MLLFKLITSIKVYWTKQGIFKYSTDFETILRIKINTWKSYILMIGAHKYLNIMRNTLINKNIQIVDITCKNNISVNKITDAILFR